MKRKTKVKMDRTTKNGQIDKKCKERQKSKWTEKQNKQRDKRTI